ncbi:MAG: NAD-binding protein [Bacteroidales bacterium]|nr:NAD-binding protein [Bacteroidales bacterium]
MNSKTNIIKLIFLFAFIVVIGTSGYMIIEQYNFIDALFMTVITITTVGYGTIKKLSETGTIFTIFLIIASFITVALIVQNFSRYISDGELLRRLKTRKIKKMMKNTENHVIVCGYGLNGSHAAIELLKAKEKVVVIDKNINVTEDAEIHGVKAIFINGDARNEEVLIEAKIDKAKALITALHLDADNLYVVLTAKELNPDLRIISRASEDSAERKLRRAGADFVILPDSVGGIRMAKLVFEPGVIEFLEHIVAKSGISVNLVEIDCKDIKSTLFGKTLTELDIRKRSGANIVGIKKPDGEFIFNPTSDQKIVEGVKLFVLGTPEQVEYFQNLVEEH